MGTCLSRAPASQSHEPTNVDSIDPAIKSLVCDACWEGVFSNDAWQAVLTAEQAPGQTGLPKGFSYETTWAAIQTATDRDGCNWCRLFARPDSTATKDDVQVEIQVACKLNTECTPAGEKMLMVDVRGRSGSSSGRLYYMYTSADDKAAKYVKARNRITDISTPESYKLALECIDNCVHNHHGTCPPPQLTRLPDRVIDCSDARRPKILLTGGDKYGHFLVLSYVWGGPQPLSLKKENIDEYVTYGLDISKFPQTIQDAVLVTRSIGQRYLWIDALCIIQDSAEDKNRQLGRMREIYHNSYLAINAACAQSSHEGLLHRQRPQKVLDPQIPYRCPDGSVGSIWIASPVDAVLNASRAHWPVFEPINCRGWCFQEKVLPPRSLIFASDTLKYYCQTETVSIGHALCKEGNEVRLPNAKYRPPSSSRERALSKADRYRLAWHSVIYTYTPREISIPSDRLVALAGVAEQFHLMFKDQYLAGLWRKALLLDLLWTQSGVPCARPAYRAPSWSWASIDGPVVPFPCGGTKLPAHLRGVKVLECRVKPASEHAPFGEVTGGVLRVKGMMARVVLEKERVLLVGQSQEPVHIGSVSFDADEERPGDVYVVPLVWNTSPTAHSFPAGIVVAKVGDDPSRYRRIGMFNCATEPEAEENDWQAGVSEQEIVLV